MERRYWFWVLAVILGGGVAAYYWQQSREEPAMPPPVAQVDVPPPAPPAEQPAEPVIRHPVEAPPEQVQPEPQQQPAAAPRDADTVVRQALAGALGESTVARFFHTDAIVRRIVATVDNLPRKKAPVRLMPVKRVPSAFVTSDGAGVLTIAPDNAARYTPYVEIVQAIDARKLVRVYAHLYPLFQRAYEELGYPGRYFNDRLVETLDDLLAAPEVEQPLAVTQSKVLYEFADPDLEGRSAGQKILLRMGGENAAVVKAKLREIRREVTRGSAPQ